jgi:hypothetical protein
VCTLFKLCLFAIPLYIAYFKWEGVLEEEGLWEELEVDGRMLFGGIS